MKRAFIILFVLFLGFFALAIPVAAEGQQEAVGQSVAEYLPQQAQEILSQNGLSDLSMETLLSLSPKDALSYIVRCVKSEVDTPFVLIYAIFFVLVITAIVSGMSGGYFSAESQNQISVIGILCVCSVAATPVITCLSQAREFVENLTGFIQVFVPALSGIMLMSGNSAVAGGYQMGMLFAGEAICSFLSGIILPLLYLYLAFALVGRTVTGAQTERMAAAVKSTVIWSLSLVMTLFVSFITIKGMIGAGADSLALRTGKFLIGSFVPAVGGALSEAAGTVQQSMGLIKNTAGVFGMIAAAMYFLPPLVKVLLYKLTCDVAAAAGDLLGSNKIAGLLRDVSSVLGLTGAVILSYGAVTILTTAITISVGGS